MAPEENPREIKDSTYTFTLTLTRHGPGVFSRGNWLEVKETVRTHRLTLALAGAGIVLFVLIFTSIFKSPKMPDLPMPENNPRKAQEPLPSSNDVVTPLNARDPASLVLPPNR